MWKFDLRFVVVLIINIVKSHVAMPWEWDPFEVTSHLTWTKFWLLTSLLFLFGFIFVGISFTSPNNNPGFLRVQINNFSPSLLTCFLACVFFPQFLFWYVYPVILVLCSCYTCISNAFVNFALWVGALRSVMPECIISITATNGGDHGGGDQLEEAAANLQASLNV